MEWDKSAHNKIKVSPKKYFVHRDHLDTIYNDLPNLIQEREDLKGKATSLGTLPFKFDKLLSTIERRKNKIDRIRLKGDDELEDDINELVSQIQSKKVPVEQIVS